MAIRIYSSFLRPTRSLTAVLLACTLSACTDPASLALGGVSAVSFVQSGKTLTDHAMSLATDQDCSIRHSLSGKAWCLPVSTPRPAYDQAEAGDLHCYRSIGTMTCYRHKNPHDTASRYTVSDPGRQNAEIAESYAADTQ